MLRRLVGAVRYLVTGDIKSAQNGSAGASVAEIIPPASTNLPVKTLVEIRDDTLHIEAGENRDPIALLANPDSFAGLDEETRLELTRKIARLVPMLAETQQEQLLRHVYKTLQTLAQDQVGRIRRVIAQEFRQRGDAPLDLIHQLALDKDISVAGPILEYSPLLTEQDLLEIIAQCPLPGMLAAIAHRQNISTDITGALVHNVKQSGFNEGNMTVITALLENKSATIEEDVLESVIDEAPQFPSWHPALVDRPELTVRMVNKIGRFVSAVLLEKMQQRGVIKPNNRNRILQQIAKRMNTPRLDWEKEADHRAYRMFTEGKLSVEQILEAIEKGEKEFAVSATTILAHIPKKIVKDILASDDPRAIVSLAWKTGMGMRDAIIYQLKFAKIHYTKIIYAKNGTDYPLTIPQMERLLQKYESKLIWSS